MRIRRSISVKNRHKNVVVTGEPGTGKTFTIEQMIAHDHDFTMTGFDDNVKTPVISKKTKSTVKNESDNDSRMMHGTGVHASSVKVSSLSVSSDAQSTQSFCYRRFDETRFFNLMNGPEVESMMDASMGTILTDIILRMSSITDDDDQRLILVVRNPNVAALVSMVDPNMTMIVEMSTGDADAFTMEQHDIVDRFEFVLIMQDPPTWGDMYNEAWYVERHAMSALYSSPLTEDQVRYVMRTIASIITGEMNGDDLGRTRSPRVPSSATAVIPIDFMVTTLEHFHVFMEQERVNPNTISRAELRRLIVRFFNDLPNRVNHDMAMEMADAESASRHVIINDGRVISDDIDDLDLSSLFSGLIPISPDADENTDGDGEESSDSVDWADDATASAAPAADTIPHGEDTARAHREPASAASRFESTKNRKKKRFKKLPYSDISTLHDRLGRNVVNQDDAIRQIVDCIKIDAAGLRNEERPIAAFLFDGPSGVGKTELAKQLAREAFVKPVNMIRLDMSEYAASEDVTKIFGSAPGYQDSDRGGQLTNKVMEHPQSVILLDEAEKASPQVWNSFLQVFGEGRMTDGRGVTVDFTNTIIILTSNLGNKEALRPKAGFGKLRGSSIGSDLRPDESNSADNDANADTDAVMGSAALDRRAHEDESLTDADRADMESIMRKAIDDYFQPELLGRMDAIIMFNRLRTIDLIEIIHMQVSALSTVLASRHHGLTIDPIIDDDVISLILDSSDTTRYGAREIQRTIRSKITLPLSDWLISCGNIDDSPAGKDTTNTVNPSSDASRDTIAHVKDDDKSNDKNKSSSTQSETVKNGGYRENDILHLIRIGDAITFRIMPEHGTGITSNVRSDDGRQ